MEKEDEIRISFENNAPTMDASAKKAQLVSSIIENAEQGDEEENMGRS